MKRKFIECEIEIVLIDQDGILLASIDDPIDGDHRGEDIFGWD